MTSLGSTTSTASPLREKPSYWLDLFAMLDTFRHFWGSHRTSGCLRYPVQNKRVRIVKKVETGKARYTHLQHCTKVWTCPICSDLIGAKRRPAINYAVSEWVKQGNQCSLATFTIQHNKDMSLDECMNILQGSYREMVAGKAWQTIKDNHKVLGAIRVIEITWGNNGYHTHIHSIVFHNSQDLESMESSIRSRWEQMTGKRGNSINEHGFDLSHNSDYISQYISKHGRHPIEEWNQAKELTSKAGKTVSSGRTFFQVLHDASHGSTRGGDRRFMNSYVERLHNVKFLVWSPTVSKHFGIKDLTDEELAPHLEVIEQKHEEHFATLSHDAWRIIRDKYMRGAVLDIATAMTFEEFQDWMQKIGVGIDTVHIDMSRDIETVWGGGVTSEQK